MDISKLNCAGCSLQFQKEENDPRIIPYCGHTICSNCLTIMLSDNKISFPCPICQRLVKLPKENKLTIFPVNRILIDMIQDMETIDKCSSHQSVLELYCIDCCTKICNKCLFSGNHREHNVDLIENFMKEANSKRKDIQEWVSKINNQYKSIEGYIDAYHKKMVQLAEESFEKLIKIIQLKQADSIVNINNYFMQMKKSIGNATKEKPNPVIEFKTRVESLSTFWGDNISFSDAVKINSEDFSKILPDVKKWVQHDNLSDTKDKLRKLALSFNTSLFTAFEDCCLVEETNQPIQELSNPKSTSIDKDKMEIVDSTSAHAREAKEGSGTQSKPKKLIIPGVTNQLTPTLSDIPAQSSQNIQETFQSSPETPTLGPKIDLPSAVNVNVAQLEAEGKSLEEIQGLIASNENLSMFELTLGEADVKKNMLNIFLQNIGGCVSMESLSLNFRYNNSVNDEVIKALSSSLSKLSKLKSLNIDLSGCDLVSIKSASALMDSLNVMKDLEVFRISFENCDRIEQDIMEKMSETLFSLKSINKLYLNLKDCSLIGEEGLQLLSKPLKNFGENLLELELTFGKSNLSQEGIISLAKALNYTTQLEIIVLDFSENFLVEDKEALELISSVSSMINLKKITFKFDKCFGISTLSLNSFGQALVNLKKLTDIHLGLESCRNIGEEGFLSLSKGISKLESLQVFGLFVMESTQITDECMNHVVEALQSCKKMKRLYFSFDGCVELTDNFLLYLSDALGMMFDLELLMLPLEGCNKITSHGLQFLFDVFSDLEKLQEISLYLGGCTWIDNDSMKKFSNALIVLKNLKTLVLDISKHVTVTDEGIQALGKALADLNNLVQLSLFLDGCKLLTIEGFTRFAQFMLSLNELQRVEISLQNCPDIDDTKVTMIKSLFDQKKNLELRINV